MADLIVMLDDVRDGLARVARLKEAAVRLAGYCQELPAHETDAELRARVADVVAAALGRGLEGGL